MDWSTGPASPKDAHRPHWIDRLAPPPFCPSARVVDRSPTWPFADPPPHSKARIRNILQRRRKWKRKRQALLALARSLASILRLHIKHNAEYLKALDETNKFTIIINKKDSRLDLPRQLYANDSDGPLESTSNSSIDDGLVNLKTGRKSKKSPNIENIDLNDLCKSASLQAIFKEVHLHPFSPTEICRVEEENIEGKNRLQNPATKEMTVKGKNNRSESNIHNSTVTEHLMKALRRTVNDLNDSPDKQNKAAESSKTTKSLSTLHARAVLKALTAAERKLTNIESQKANARETKKRGRTIATPKFKAERARKPAEDVRGEEELAGAAGRGAWASPRPNAVERRREAAAARLLARDKERERLQAEARAFSVARARAEATRKALAAMKARAQMRERARQRSRSHSRKAKGEAGASAQRDDSPVPPKGKGKGHEADRPPAVTSAGPKRSRPKAKRPSSPGFAANPNPSSSRKVHDICSRIMEGRGSRDTEELMSRSMEGHGSRNLNDLSSNITEGHSSSNKEGPSSRIGEGHISRKIEDLCFEIMGGHKIGNKEGQSSKNMEGHGSRNIEDRSSRDMERHISRKIEGLSSRNNEGHSSRNIEGHNSRSMEGQSSRNIEGPRFRNIEGQISRIIEDQSSKDKEGHSSRKREGHSSNNIETRMEGSSFRSVEIHIPRNKDCLNARNTEVNSPKNKERLSSTIVEGHSSRNVEGLKSSNMKDITRSTEGPRDDSRNLEGRGSANVDGPSPGKVSSEVKCSTLVPDNEDTVASDCEETVVSDNEDAEDVRKRIHENLQGYHPDPQTSRKAPRPNPTASLVATLSPIMEAPMPHSDSPLTASDDSIGNELKVSPAASANQPTTTATAQPPHAAEKGARIKSQSTQSASLNHDAQTIVFSFGPLVSCPEYPATSEQFDLNHWRSTQKVLDASLSNRADTLQTSETINQSRLLIPATNFNRGNPTLSARIQSSPVNDFAPTAPPMENPPRLEARTPLQRRRSLSAEITIASPRQREKNASPLEAQQADIQQENQPAAFVSPERKKIPPGNDNVAIHHPERQEHHLPRMEKNVESVSSHCQTTLKIAASVACQVPETNQNVQEIPLSQNVLPEFHSKNFQANNVVDKEVQIYASQIENRKSHYVLAYNQESELASRKKRYLLDEGLQCNESELEKSVLLSVDPLRQKDMQLHPHERGNRLYERGKAKNRIFKETSTSTEESHLFDSEKAFVLGKKDTVTYKELDANHPNISTRSFHICENFPHETSHIHVQNNFNPGKGLDKMSYDAAKKMRSYYSDYVDRPIENRVHSSLYTVKERIKPTAETYEERPNISLTEFTSTSPYAASSPSRLPAFYLKRSRKLGGSEMERVTTQQENSSNYTIIHKPPNEETHTKYFVEHMFQHINPILSLELESKTLSYPITQHKSESAENLNTWGSVGSNENGSPNEEPQDIETSSRISLTLCRDKGDEVRCFKREESEAENTPKHQNVMNTSRQQERDDTPEEQSAFPNFSLLREKTHYGDKSRNPIQTDIHQRDDEFKFRTNRIYAKTEQIKHFIQNHLRSDPYTSIERKAVSPKHLNTTFEPIKANGQYSSPSIAGFNSKFGKQCPPVGTSSSDLLKSSPPSSIPSIRRRRKNICRTTISKPCFYPKPTERYNNNIRTSMAHSKPARSMTTKIAQAVKIMASGTTGKNVHFGVPNRTCKTSLYTRF